jgi:hypothetical protein
MGEIYGINETSSEIAVAETRQESRKTLVTHA